MDKNLNDKYASLVHSPPEKADKHMYSTVLIKSGKENNPAGILKSQKMKRKSKKERVKSMSNM